MGQPEVQKKLHTIDEWLALEESEGIRYEYHFGEVFAMAGGTFAHGTITDNAFFEIEAHNRSNSGKCRTFSSEFKTQIDKANRYVYPDITVVCGKVDQSDETVGAITNPILVIEVVSDSSESYDRGQKYRYYRRLPSVKEYLLLEQKKPGATLYRRNGDGDLFTRLDYERLETIVDLQCLDLKFPLSAFYRNVEFSSETRKTHAE